MLVFLSAAQALNRPYDSTPYRSCARAKPYTADMLRARLNAPLVQGAEARGRPVRTCRVRAARSVRRAEVLRRQGPGILEATEQAQPILPGR
jgi:hypothetical protein